MKIDQTHEVFRCDHGACRATIRADTIAADKAGWDWFTGYSLRTLHYCPAHANSRERHEAYRKSQDPASRETP